MTIHPKIPLPDTLSLEPEVDLGDRWDTEAIRDLIRAKCSDGGMPSFLFLGKHEAGLLRSHLAQVFGAAAVTTLKDTYYMGLEVIELECPRFLFAAGRKTIRAVPSALAPRPSWREGVPDALWQLRLR